MKKFKYEFEVDDDFEVGECDRCPFQELEWYDDDGYNDCSLYCIVWGYGDEKCPLEEVK